MPHATADPVVGTPGARAGNLVSLLPVLLAVATYLAVAFRVQLRVSDAVLGVGAVLLTQVLPGALLWRAARPRDGWLLEDLAVGFALGSALAVPAQVLAGLSRFQPFAWGLPVAVAVLVLAVPATRRRAIGARWVRMPWWLPWVLSAASLAALAPFRDYVVTNRLVWESPGRPHIDTYLHLALSSELLHRGPAAWPTVLGEDLGYHWFTHAWIAQVSNVSGVGLDVVLIRLLPAFMPVAVTLAVGLAALRLVRSPWLAAAAAVLTMAGGAADLYGLARQGLPVNPLSPTLALGAPTLLALVTVLALRWRGQLHRGGYLLVPFLAVVSAGTKGSTVPIVVAGLALALVATLLWNRRLAAKVALDLVVVAAALVLVLLVVFHGSSAGLELDLPAAGAQTALAVALGVARPEGLLLALCLLSAVLSGIARAALGFVLPLDGEGRADPLGWTLLGAAGAGAAAVGVFAHPGASQYYFLLTAIPLAALSSAVGLGVVGRRLGTRRAMTVVGAGALLGAALFLLDSEILGPLRRGDTAALTPLVGAAVAAVALAAVLGTVLAGRARLVGLVACVGGLALGLGASGFVVATATRSKAPAVTAPSLRWPLATSQGQIDAARWIRDHSGVDDIVMTNRHCTVPRKPVDGCDSRRWVVTAFSERQLLVEGWTATPRATRIAPRGRDSITVNYWKPDILALNDGFYTRPSEEARRRLWELGVRWVYMENTIPHARTLAPYAVERFSTTDASAWQLLPPG